MENEIGREGEKSVEFATPESSMFNASSDRDTDANPE